MDMDGAEDTKNGAKGGKRSVPRFSLGYTEPSVDPRTDFYNYAVGAWVRANPVPPDKTRWGAFNELHEWNRHLLLRILEDSVADTSSEPGSVRRLVGDFYKSAMDTARIERLGLEPALPQMQEAEKVVQGEEMAQYLADLRTSGVPALFNTYSAADKKNSSIYALYLDQVELSLPDREYYLATSFAGIREAYRNHVARMFALAGGRGEENRQSADLVLGLETDLARASRTRTELRDEEKNYNRTAIKDLGAELRALRLPLYLASLGVPPTEYVVVGQPEFFDSLDRLISERPIEDWRTYLRWRVLHRYAPFLHQAVEAEDFDFFHRRLLGQQEPEPRWKRALNVIDELMGEALGKLYVERHFPPEARQRVSAMIDDLRAVFRERLSHLPWMTEATRQQALSKFDRFTVKIGHPERFRDYSSVAIDLRDYVGNVRRLAAFEAHRQASRVGKPVDRTEWEMTPPTVNAYFSPVNNEIVFPAGILQPPFFDITLDDAVNYGGMGAVIGHEITHGYDDQGRKFDAEGNLRDWWSPDDAREFQARALGVARIYGAQEPLPGIHINGELTLGENIADLGGVSLAYDALQRGLAREPSKRRRIDGFSPEQRFFIAWAQTWRENIREEELRRSLTVDPHSPAKYRGMLPATNHPAFGQAFPPPDGQRDASGPDEKVEVW